MDFVRGDATGLLIPAHRDALHSLGESFLTEAFQAFGALSSSNRITRITRLGACPGGSTGQKLFLSVEYEKPEPGLHVELFVKFSRDFGDPIRDRGRYELESEVRFAALSHQPGFPISVPAAYFADYHHETGTGVLITQRVAFGAGGIEPHRQKCLDHELAEPLAYYRVIVKALARLAAAHKSGRLSPDIDARFPFDAKAAAASDPIPYDEPQLRGLVAQYGEFATTYPQLLPANIASPEFLAKLDREVGRFLAHEATIKRFLQSDPDFIALCHWNAHIDNAWFWRDASGELHCGLMDWGRVRQLNVAFALWGCLSGAPLEIWDLPRRAARPVHRRTERARRPPDRCGGAETSPAALRGDDGPRLADGGAGEDPLPPARSRQGDRSARSRLPQERDGPQPAAHLHRVPKSLADPRFWRDPRGLAGTGLSRGRGRELMLSHDDALDEGVEVRETGHGKFQVEVRAAGARLIVDEPAEVGGLGAGPTPYDLLASALGACTTMTVRLYADRKAWPLSSVRVRVVHRRGGLDAQDRFAREIVLEGDLAPEQRGRLLEIANRCPVHLSLERGAEIITVLAERPLAGGLDPAPTEHMNDMMQACRD